MKTLYKYKIPMRLWAEGDLPDHKLLFSGSGSLSDVELLAIIIGSGIKDFSSMDIAKQMLGKADNNLCNFWKLSYSDLKSFTGIGKKKALRLSAFFILARRRNESDAMERIKINDSRVAAEIFKSIMVDLPYEEFWMIMLNKANVVIKKVRISEGGVSGTVVDPKKIFKIALDHHTISIILGHYHPSGNIQPSEADTKITKKVKECGIFLYISVLDHIIIGCERFYSYADEGAL